MKTNYLKTLIISIFLFSAIINFYMPTIVIASDKGLLPNETGNNPCPHGYDGNCGNYTTNDIISISIIVAKWILGIVGSLTLLFFIYGGVMFILSGGNSEKVSQGKQILINAVIGLVIVFTSYLIIQFTMSVFGLGEKWSQTGWF